MEKLIVTVAGVGAETTKEAQPNLPITPREIGVDAARCRAAAGGCSTSIARRPRRS